ncbi:MAG: 23S rRNA (adenine(2030)-N(6))-methyltransferase RlmJ [Rhodospirillales bacterium]|nr:23S rRNA (adenine(2030)-N(6))-methyltransferase RlmJ [Rhodospirillales bacterium]
MNYRHAFHAGNFADVVKHAVLALVIEHLKRKDQPFRVIDTHAGLGRYDLEGEQAGKTGEWRGGIARMMTGPPVSAALEPYLAVVRAMNPADGSVRFYPGSPRLSRALIRPQDKLALVELHPRDAAALKAEFRRDEQVKVMEMDAYAALKGLLPPPERRGVVLIDPPFEVKGEFERIRRGLSEAFRRWPTGIYMIWYPIKGHGPVRTFLDSMKELAVPMFTAEVMLRSEENIFRLNGCGLLVLNPPWKLDEAVADLLAELKGRLTLAQGTAALEWLVGPD